MMSNLLKAGLNVKGGNEERFLFGLIFDLAISARSAWNRNERRKPRKREA